MHSALGAKRQRFGRGVGFLLETDQLQRAHGFGVNRRLLGAMVWQAKERRHEPVLSPGMTADHDVLQHRHASKQAHCLKCDGQPETRPPIRRQSRDVLFAQRY